jgi:hypothetical protein
MTTTGGYQLKCILVDETKAYWLVTMISTIATIGGEGRMGDVRRVAWGRFKPH